MIVLLLGYLVLRPSPVARRARGGPNLFMLLIDIWLCWLVWDALSWVIYKL